MLLFLYPKINLMEDELEEGEIIETPLLPTPQLKRKRIDDSFRSKIANCLSAPLSTSRKKRLNHIHKPYVCKTHKKNVKKYKSSENVRVVKYKISPENFKPKKVNVGGNYDRETKNVPKENIDWQAKYRPFPRRYRDSLFEDTKHDINDESSYEDLLNQYKSIQLQLKSLRQDTRCDKNILSVSDIKLYPKARSSKRKKSLSQGPSDKVNILDNSKELQNSSPLKTSPKVKTPAIECVEIDDDDNEDDDLEFLRQKALESRLKPLSPLKSKNQELVIKDSDTTTNILSTMLDTNYDIVDMDISDDDIDNIDDELLTEHDFNIVKNAILLEEKIDPDFNISSIIESDDSDNDDDLIMLRSELIAGMKEKQKLCHIDNVVDKLHEKEITSNVNAISNRDDTYIINDSENVIIGENKCQNPLTNCEDINIMKPLNVPLCEEVDCKISNAKIINVPEVTSSESNFEIISKTETNISIKPSSTINHISASLEVVNQTLHSELSSLINKENIELCNIMVSQKNLFSSENFHRKNVLNKKSIPFISQPVEPVVIQLGQESSDSESEDEQTKPNDNVLASLEKLIESAKNNTENVSQNDSKVTSSEPSCQDIDSSKKSTEEVVKKILPIVESKPSRQFINIFNNLRSKLIIASATHYKDQQLFNTVKMQANKKKSDFLASQIKVKRLQEQLIAAQKMKNDNLKLMYSANTKLAEVQKAMNMKRSVIEDLRKECTKRGMQIFGPNYVLPKFGINSPFKFRQKILGMK